MKNISVSNLQMRTKILLVIGLLLLSAILSISMAIHTFLTEEKQKRDNMESLAVIASDQYLEMTIESGIAIAKGIYTNDSLYAFLNTEFTSSASYFSEYQNFLKENPLVMAETTMIADYKIYTGNTTIMSGTDFRSLQSVENEDWYKTLSRLGKSMILYCDASKGTLSIIRKLDYYSDSIENYLKLDLNTSLFTNYCDSIQFDGELYIISDSMVLYSNQELSEKPDITQDFHSYTQNYYTTDIQYYALAEQTGCIELFLKEWIWILLLFILLAAAFFVGILFIKDIRQRTETAITAYYKNGNLSNFSLQGCDEISKLTALSISLSDKLALRNRQYERSQEQLQKKNKNYCDLFGQSLYLDAVLQISRKYPDVRIVPDVQWHSLCSELAVLQHCRSGMTMPEQLSESWSVPVYALLFVIDALCENDKKIVCFCDDTSFSLTANVQLSQTHMLKLQAIFEEDEVSNHYSFQPNDTYNAYLRLKHCFGNRVTLLTENGLTIRIQF